MQVKLTRHALQRTKERKITLEEITRVIENPDEMSFDQFGNRIAQKRFDDLLLRSHLLISSYFQAFYWALFNTCAAVYAKLRMQQLCLMYFSV